MTVVGFANCPHCGREVAIDKVSTQPTDEMVERAARVWWAEHNANAWNPIATACRVYLTLARHALTAAVKEREEGPVPNATDVVGHVCSGDKSCGRPIPLGHEYRCLDCDAVMHKDCLRWHCGNDEKDRMIYSLQGMIDESRAQIERICKEDEVTITTLTRERDEARGELGELREKYCGAVEKYSAAVDRVEQLQARLTAVTRV